MRSLKQRRYEPAAYSQPRRNRLAIIRSVYLAGIAMLVLWILHFTLSGVLYLRADGMVVGTPAVVAAEFPVTIRELRVRQGEFVRTGQVAAVVSSQQVAESVARLTAELQARLGRQSELRMRRETIAALLPMAEKRARLASEARQTLDGAAATGHAALNSRTSALEMEYRGLQDLQGLLTEKEEIARELTTLAPALAEFQTAIEELRKLYDAGLLRIPVDGIISRVVANEGAVVRAGEPIVELEGIERFILAYVPMGGLYAVRAGDEVNIQAGFQTFRGTIARVEPLATDLPREFQQVFQPIETQQIVRVEFAPGVIPPPLFAKVSLTASAMTPQLLTRLWR